MLVHNIIVNDDGSLFLPLPLSSRPLRATETSHQYEVSEFMVNFISNQQTDSSMHLFSITQRSILTMLIKISLYDKNLIVINTEHEMGK